jgi:hypothetical protein
LWRIGDAHSTPKELPFLAFSPLALMNFWLLLFSVWS